MKGLLFTYALTYGGALTSLFNPYYGLLAWVIFSTIKPDSLWYWNIPEASYAKIIAAGLIVGWIAHGMGSWRLGRSRIIMGALVAYWIWKVFGAIAAPDQEIAWEEVDRQTKILLPVFIGITLIDSLPRLRGLAWTCMLSIAYVGFEANLDHFQGGSRLEVDGYFSMDNNSACIALISGIGLAFFLGISQQSIVKRWLCFVLSGLLAHCPIFGDSRGGMLGVVSTGFATAVLLRREPKHWKLLVLGMVSALALLGSRAQESWNSIFAPAEVRDDSAQGRLELWKGCWDAMLRHPILGLGPDHWELAAKDYYGWGTGKASHSLWFNTGAEMGFPGLFFLLLFFGATIVLCWPIAQSAANVDPFLRTVARMVISSLAGYVVAVAFVSVDRLEFPLFIAMLGAGCIRIAETEHKVSSTDRQFAQ